MLAKKLILSQSNASTAARCFSTEIEKLVEKHSKKFPNLETYSLKRGSGNRSSFNGTVVTVFGSTGSYGNSLIPALARIGCQIILPYRGNLAEVLRFKAAGDLGQIHFVPFYLKDEESIHNSVKYSNVVINLIGKFNETVNFSFKDVHVDGAQLIAKVAKQNNVTRFVQFSSLNADPSPVGHLIRDGSEFLRTKYYGELAVREEFPEAIIFRPSRIFGLQDYLFNFYFNRKNYLFRKMPLWNKGYGIYKQPVFQGDVSQGVINAIYENEVLGKTIEAVGPRRYELNELVKFFMRSVARGEKNYHEITELRTSVSYLARAVFCEKAFKYPSHCLELLELECLTDKLTPGNLTLEDLGVKLGFIEDEYHMVAKLNHMDHLTEKLNPQEEPPLPKYV